MATFDLTKLYKYNSDNGLVDSAYYPLLITTGSDTAYEKDININSGTLPVMGAFIYNLKTYRGQLSDGQSITVYSNGNKTVQVHRYSGSSMAVRVFSGTTMIAETDFYTDYGDYAMVNYGYMYGIFNGTPCFFQIKYTRYNGSSSANFRVENLSVTNSTINTALLNWINGAIAPSYDWTAWDQIAGNGGQYRCDLTKIKEETIGDFSAIQTGDSSDFARISSQSSIWNIFHNMGFDEVRKIAWSGGNYMTMKVNEEPEYPNQYTFTFSFYNIVTVGGEQTPSLIWQDTFPITWTGEPRDTDFYLSFVYDPAEEVAVFLPVTKDTTGAYKWGWSGGLPTDVTMHNLFIWLSGSENPEIITPYTQGTEDNGGTPGGSLPQSHIDVPTAPELGAMSSGMFTLYCPTETELQHISQFLWSDNVIANIKKYFNNFSDNIMALYVLPYKPSNNPVKVFQVGNMASNDAELSAVEYIDDRFVSVDMGEVKIKPFWGSYLDYAPYSSLQVILPGVGVQSLDVDDIFCPADQDGNLPAPSEATIHIDYTIDLMTGVIVAFISINGEMRYQFPGKLGYQIPLTGENYVRMAQGFVTAAAGLIGTVVSGGAAAPFAAPAATAGIINAMKPDVYRGGNLSGDASMLARLTPTLIYRRPNKPLLEDQGEFTGFPSYKIGLLSEFSGYTEVIDAHVEGISCTDEERELILNALKEGVII